MVITIDEAEMAGVMMASMVRRLRDRGWTKENAERISGKAMAKVRKKIGPTRNELIPELELAFEAGADEKSLKLLITSAFALAGVDIADDLTRTSIAERN